MYSKCIQSITEASNIKHICTHLLVRMYIQNDNRYFAMMRL